MFSTFPFNKLSNIPNIIKSRVVELQTGAPNYSNKSLSIQISLWSLWSIENHSLDFFVTGACSAHLSELFQYIFCRCNSENTLTCILSYCRSYVWVESRFLRSRRLTGPSFIMSKSRPSRCRPNSRTTFRNLVKILFLFAGPRVIFNQTIFRFLAWYQTPS